MTALVRQGKRNTDSEYILHPFRCCAHSVHAASDGAGAIRGVKLSLLFIPATT